VRSEVDGNVEVKDAYQDVLREIDIMKELDHLCLIRLHEVINEKDGDKLYMGKAMAEILLTYSHGLC
jgi:hypothetical protein